MCAYLGRTDVQQSLNNLMCPHVFWGAGRSIMASRMPTAVDASILQRCDIREQQHLVF